MIVIMLRKREKSGNIGSLCRFYQQAGQQHSWWRVSAGRRMDRLLREEKGENLKLT